MENNIHLSFRFSLRFLHMLHLSMLKEMCFSHKICNIHFFFFGVCFNSTKHIWFYGFGWKNVCIIMFGNEIET